MFEQDGHRSGDWLHRDLRDRAAAERRAAAEEERRQQEAEGNQWYRQTFWIIVLIALFWPVGLFLAWKSNWPLTGKILATVIIAALLVFIVTQSAITSGAL